MPHIIADQLAAGCEIIGVEITDSAVAVNTQPFFGNTAFMLGNEVSYIQLGMQHGVHAAALLQQSLHCTSLHYTHILHVLYSSPYHTP